MSANQKITMWLITLAVAVLFGIFVWPTPYTIRMRHNDNDGNNYPHRVNRFTGR